MTADETRQRYTRLSDSMKASVGERIDHNRAAQLVPEIRDARPRINNKMVRCWTGIDVNRAVCAEKSGLFPLIKIATDNENSDSALKIKDSVDKKDNRAKNNNGKKARFPARTAQNGTPDDDETEKKDWLGTKIDD